MGVELNVGEPAPDFTATAVGGKYGSGQQVSLAQLRGRPVVLYFYPKDDTPGCTVQACALRDSWRDRKSTRLNSSHANISYAVFCLKKNTTPGCDRLLQINRGQ